jgi:hypothetical protein
MQYISDIKYQQLNCEAKYSSTEENEAGTHTTSDDFSLPFEQRVMAMFFSFLSDLFHNIYSTLYNKVII